MRTRPLLALLTFLIALPLSAQDKTQIETKTLVFQNGLANYSGTVEANLFKGQAPEKTTNRLWIGRKAKRDEDSSLEQHALLRFDNIFGNTDERIPLGATITKATLRITSGPEKGDRTNRISCISRMLVPWDANASWENGPWGRDGIRIDNKTAATAYDACFVLNHPGTAFDIDVTESLRAWASGAPNHGWVLYAPAYAYNPASFISCRAEKNPKRRPMLTVSYDTAPANRAPSAQNLSATLSPDNSVTLSLTANDDGNTPLSVSFHGRKKPACGPDFEVVLLPDTQYYTAVRFGGTTEMFTSQVDWIIKNRKERNIAFVLHLGDITDRGDMPEEEFQWKNALDNMRRLEDPKTTGLPEGIPYLLSVGNHDQFQKMPDGTRGKNGPAAFYNKYFGVNYFKNKSYYGGYYGNNNNNYYTLFEAGMQKFVCLSLEFDFLARNPDILKWAKNVLDTHADRHAIVVTHAALLTGFQPDFLPDGKHAYDALKDCPNLRLIIGGHVSGVGYREDTHKNSLVNSILVDFQSGYGAGGNGWLSILRFSLAKNKITLKTYSPSLDQWMTDNLGTRELSFNTPDKNEPFTKLGETQTTPGNTATFQWQLPDPGASYEWFAEISDGQKTIQTKELLITPASQ